MSDTVFQPEETAVKIDDHDNTLVAIQDNINSTTISTSFETDDASVHGGSAEANTVGHADAGQFGIGGPLTERLMRLAMGQWRAPGGKTFSVENMPGGDESGKPLQTFETILQNLEVSTDDGSTSTISLTYKVDGEVTTSTVQE